MDMRVTETEGKEENHGTNMLRDWGGDGQCDLRRIEEQERKKEREE